MSTAPVMVKRADDIDAARDVVLCMPAAARPGARYPENVRIPVRSSWVDGRYLEYVSGSRTVVAPDAADRLRHLILSFPDGCFTHGVRTFDNDRGATASVLLSFALYEPRSAESASADGAATGPPLPGPPPPAAAQALERLDALSAFLSAACIGCDALRRSAGLTTDELDPTMSVVRPAHGGVRYCNAKVVVAAVGKGKGAAPATKFLTPNGGTVPLERVREWRNFRVAPYVDVDEIFVSGGRRSLQLKLRECVVYPPSATAPPPVATRRPSVAFPDRMCGAASAEDEDVDSSSSPSAAKRARH